RPAKLVDRHRGRHCGTQRGRPRLGAIRAVAIHFVEWYRDCGDRGVLDCRRCSRAYRSEARCTQRWDHRNRDRRECGRLYRRRLVSATPTRHVSWWAERAAAGIADCPEVRERLPETAEG